MQWTVISSSNSNSGEKPATAANKLDHMNFNKFLIILRFQTFLYVVSFEMLHTDAVYWIMCCLVVLCAAGDICEPENLKSRWWWWWCDRWWSSKIPNPLIFLLFSDISHIFFWFLLAFSSTSSFRSQHYRLRLSRNQKWSVKVEPIVEISPDVRLHCGYMGLFSIHMQTLEKKEDR